MLAIFVVTFGEWGGVTIGSEGNLTLNMVTIHGSVLIGRIPAAIEYVEETLAASWSGNNQDEFLSSGFLMASTVATMKTEWENTCNDDEEYSNNGLIENVSGRTSERRGF